MFVIYTEVFIAWTIGVILVTLSTENFRRKTKTGYSVEGVDLKIGLCRY